MYCAIEMPFRGPANSGGPKAPCTRCGQDRGRGDKSAMRPFAKFLRTLFLVKLVSSVFLFNLVEQCSIIILSLNIAHVSMFSVFVFV